MQGTSSHGSAVSDGLQSTKAEAISLEPWDIAVKLLPIENEQPVRIEFATDAQFQAWIVSQGVPVDENGIAEWSFDDRCGVITYALSCGLSLHFAGETLPESIPDNADQGSVEAVFEDDKAAP
jgi:hypothetical protein